MKKIAIVALLSAFFAAPVVAADGYGDEYGGVNVGQNKVDDSTMSKNTSTAFGIMSGSAISETFAVEAAYTYLGSLEPDPAFPGLTLEGSAISLSGVVSYPLDQWFSLYGKLGFARTAVDISYPGVTLSGNKTGLTFGFGGQLNVAPGVDIRAGFDRYKVVMSVPGSELSADTDVMSVGAVFNFHSP